MISQLRIGSRASPLAVAQAQQVMQALQHLHPGLVIRLHTITTQGDRAGGKPLSAWGYKGLFTKELEDALLANHIDIAVHSMKDMPSTIPDDLIIAATLPRADVRDGWVSAHHASYKTLPEYAVVGTSSVRRAAQLRLLHPNARIVPFRGNVQTRLQKLHDGVAEATFLACAGLDRLGLNHHVREKICPSVMLPAVAQGAIGVECLHNNMAVRLLLEPLHHAPTHTALVAERSMLALLDGSCKTPIAGLAELTEPGTLRLRGQVIAPDGSGEVCYELSGAAHDAERIGRQVGDYLLANSPSHWRTS
jgi:hydroxymethylbilane synthase